MAKSAFLREMLSEQERSNPGLFAPCFPYSLPLSCFGILSVFVIFFSIIPDVADFLLFLVSANYYHNYMEKLLYSFYWFCLNNICTNIICIKIFCTKINCIKIITQINTNEGDDTLKITLTPYSTTSLDRIRSRLRDAAHLR